MFASDLWLITIYSHDIHKSETRFIKIQFLAVFRSLGLSVPVHCRLVV